MDEIDMGDNLLRGPCGPLLIRGKSKKCGRILYIWIKKRLILVIFSVEIRGIYRDFGQKTVAFVFKTW